MAHKKAGGTAKNNRDSQAKRRGVKKFEGQHVLAGNILIRQKGTNYFPGRNVQMGVDFTLFAVKEGQVKYTEKKLHKYDGRVFKNTIVHVE